MTTKTICGCGHPISDHTYSGDFTGCDQSKCTCNLDLGAYIDNLNADLADAKARAKTAEENWHKNEARNAKLERVETIAEEVNEWLKNNGLMGTAHQRELEAALKGVA